MRSGREIRDCRAGDDNGLIAKTDNSYGRRKNIDTVRVLWDVIARRSLQQTKTMSTTWLHQNFDIFGLRFRSNPVGSCQPAKLGDHHTAYMRTSLGRRP